MAKYADLLGKDFLYGTDDCFSLVRGFYKENYDIYITNYATPNGWWNEGENFYMNLFKQEGFYILDDLDELIEGDVLLIALGAKVASHAAVYIGDNKIVHHPVGRKSCVDVYKGLWKNCTLARIRHISRKNVKPERKDYDFKQRYDEFVDRKL